MLAFGPRLDDESVGFPRTGLSIVGARMVESTPGFYDGFPAQFHAEAAAGPPELPAQPSPRPATIVNLADVEPNTENHGQVAGPWHDLGRAAGSIRTGLKHVQVPPGMLSCPQHCHSAEEEIFVILDGEGVLWLGDDEIPVRAGHVVSRPPGTRVAHAFRGGEPRPHLPRLRHPRAQRHRVVPALEEDLLARGGRDRPRGAARLLGRRGLTHEGLRYSEPKNDALWGSHAYYRARIPRAPRRLLKESACRG